MRKKAIVLGACIVLFVGIFSARMGHFRAGTDVELFSANPDEVAYSVDKNADTESGMENPSATPVQYVDVDTDPSSYTVLVNRTYLISKDYIPEDLVVPNIPFSFVGTYEKSYMRKRAAAALEELFSAALKEGYVLKGVSGYRSYERQEQIYNNNVRTRGTEQTDKVSAIPGSSEHQTGLAIDVSCASANYALEKYFANTPEGKWLKKNCYKYGYIIRYPKGKSEITGYSYEPWHIRYVGKNLAKHLKKNKITLEEYYQLTTIDNAVAADPVEDIDVAEKNGPQMLQAPTPKPTIEPTPEPMVSKAPKVTATPKPTKKPKVTAEPVKTPKPTKTPKPVKTPKPTQKPVVTPKPESTKEPVVTAPPEPTSDTEDVSSSEE